MRGLRGPAEDLDCRDVMSVTDRGTEGRTDGNDCLWSLSKFLQNLTQAASGVLELAFAGAGLPLLGQVVYKIEACRCLGCRTSRVHGNISQVVVAEVALAT